MKSTDRLSTSIVDKNDKSMFQSLRDKLDSTVQIGTLRSTPMRIACVAHMHMNVCVLYIVLASFIYTRDYVSQKNA